MEEKGWILTLPAKADEMHGNAKPAESVKRKIHPELENDNPKGGAKKRTKVTKEGWKLPPAKTKRSVLGDIVNNLS
jgi:hypothetical protein